MSKVQYKGLYFDIHGHPEKTLPQSWRLLSPARFPKDVKIKQTRRSIAQGFVVCALGDPNNFKKRQVDSYKSVERQLNAIKKKISRSSGTVAYSGSDLSQPADLQHGVFVLGVEGGDFIGNDLSKLEKVFDMGVRVLGLTHYSANTIGSVCIGWAGRVPTPDEHYGLTPFGESVVKKAQALNMIIDLAHADERTIIQASEIATKPVMCSHTGPKSLQDFPRYISDDAILAIAATGGLIGLWPFYSRGAGIGDAETFMRFAGYIAEKAGVDHLAIGTDINGVPGNMPGYENLFDADRIPALLCEAGFSEAEIRRITGENFVRIFSQ